MQRYIVLICACLITFSGLNVHAQNDPEQIDGMLDALNEWRVGLGLVPLTINDTLNDLAQLQLDYLLTLDQIPGGGNIHTGAEGEGPRDRARFPEISWPFYENPARVSVTEIAAIGTIRFAINFWQNSDIHNRSVTNPAYREVGISTHPLASGDVLYIVLLGGRPDILPAVVDETEAENTLFLTTELIQYEGAWISQPTRFQVLGSDGSVVTDWQDWQLSIPFPDALVSATHFTVVYEDSRGTQVETIVPLVEGAPFDAPEAVAVVEEVPVVTAPELTLVYDEETISLVNATGAPLDVSGITLQHGGTTIPVDAWTQYFPLVDLVAFPDTRCLQGWSASNGGNIVKPDSCGGVASFITVENDEVVWANDTFEVLNNGVVAATCNGAAGECVVNLAGTANVAQLTLVYDAETVSIVNTTDAPIDISGISFRQGFVNVPTSAWTEDFPFIDLSVFPGARCLQAWSVSNGGNIITPDSCANPVSFVAVDDGALIWANGTFEVLNNGEVIATCNAGDGQCVVNIASEAPPAVAVVAEAQAPVATQALPTATLGPPTATPLPTITPTPTLVPTSTPTPATVIEVPAGVVPQLTLVYDAQTISIVNTNGAPLDLRGLSLRQGNTELQTLAWTQFAPSLNLRTFAETYCLQAWSVSNGGNIATPSSCSRTASFIALADNSLVWANGSFDVLNNGVVIAICQTAAGQCSVNLEAGAGSAVTDVQPTPTVVEAAAEDVPSADIDGAQVTLVYDSQTISIVNTSGAPLDLREMSLRQGGIEIQALAWTQFFPSLNLRTFAEARCLQAWSFANGGNINTPSSCSAVASSIALDDASLIWASGTFEVLNNGVVVATCDAAAGQCGVNLE